MDRVIGKPRLQSHMRVRKRALAHTLASEKYQGLQKQIILPRFTLHVIHRVLVFYVGVEAEDGHFFVRRWFSSTKIG